MKKDNTFFGNGFNFYIYIYNNWEKFLDIIKNFYYNIADNINKKFNNTEEFYKYYLYLTAWDYDEVQDSWKSLKEIKEEVYYQFITQRILLEFLSKEQDQKEIYKQVEK